MSEKKLTLKVLFLLIFSDMLEVCTHFFFKQSALTMSSLQLTSMDNVFTFIFNMLACGYFWIGLFSVVITFILWSAILSKIDLSVAVPIASFSYILLPIVSIVFLHEKISLLRWSGILFILAGVIVVSLSEKTGQTNE